MDKFLEKVIDMLVEKLTPVIDARIPIVIEQLSALIPVAAAAAAKAIADD